MAQMEEFFEITNGVWAVNSSDPKAVEMLGLIPQIITAEDKRPVREQINERYKHGGGYQPYGQGKFRIENGRLVYPGDPPLDPIAIARINNEAVVVYNYGIIAILEKGTGTFEVVRLD